MKFPKLKYVRFCRILTYITVLGAFITPIIIVINIKYIPEMVKLGIFVALMLGLLFYILKNIFNLMFLDASLAALSCYLTARRQFDMPKNFDVEKFEKRISSFGEACVPDTRKIMPDVLQYKFTSSITIFSKGSEKVVSVYRVDCLNEKSYSDVYWSAMANSNLLKGRKKPKLLDKNQQDAPLNRVTVVFIIASRIDADFEERLLKTIKKQGFDGWEVSFLPCVIDVAKQICIFDSERLGYIGFGYPVKNRGIRIIRKYLFGGKLPLAENPYMLESRLDADPEQSLWEYWGNINREARDDRKKSKEDNRRFEEMSHGDIIFEGDEVYVKWEKQGTVVIVEEDKEARKVRIFPIESWDYPKANLISNRTVKDIQKELENYFSQKGYSCEFVSEEELF